MKRRFALTPEGYKEAVQYLRRTDQYHKIDNELSVDGYTVVELANHLYSKDKDAQLIDEIVDATSDLYPMDYVNDRMD